jgi:hypothetical protein
MALDQNLKHQGGLLFHREVSDKVVEELTDDSLDQYDTVKQCANVQGNQEIVCNPEINLLALNLELVIHGSLLDIVLDNFANLSKYNE